MIAQCARKRRCDGLDQRVERARAAHPGAGAARATSASTASMSAFASLSTVPRPEPFARDAAQLVRPGGRLIAAHAEPLQPVGVARLRRAWRLGRAPTRSAAAPRRSFTIGGQSVAHSVYFAHDAYDASSSRRFGCASGTGSAPAAAAHRAPHPAALAARLEQLDVATGAWPLVRDAGRFFVLDLERRSP